MQKITITKGSNATSAGEELLEMSDDGMLEKSEGFSYNEASDDPRRKKTGKSFFLVGTFVVVIVTFLLFVGVLVYAYKSFDSEKISNQAFAFGINFINKGLNELKCHHRTDLEEVCHHFTDPIADSMGIFFDCDLSQLSFFRHRECHTSSVLFTETVDTSDVSSALRKSDFSDQLSELQS